MMDDEDFDAFFDPDTLCCFERLHNTESVPEPFTSATIHLDLSPSSPLSWDLVRAHCQDLIKNGFQIVFDLDFGFLRPDFKGFLHQSYYQACRFAVDHFLSELLPECEEHAIGAILAKVDTSFIADRAKTDLFLDYLDRLSSLMPANFERFLLIKTAQDTFQCYQELHSELFQGFTLALQSSPYCTSHITWEKGPRLSGYIGRAITNKIQAPKLALLIPSDENASDAVKSAFQTLDANYRVIAENELTHAWDGIDKLYLPNWKFSKITQRALDGFIAAGGMIGYLT